MGGIEAVVWTDVVQTFVLLGGASLAIALIVARCDGGLAGFVDIARQHDKFHMVEWTWDMTVPVLWIMLIGQILHQLVPYTADQAVVQRYLTAKTDAEARRAIWTNAIIVVPASLLFFGLGTALFVFYQQHPGRLDPTMPIDAVFPQFIARELPVGVAGLVVAGIFAAAQSTISSSMNSVATAAVTDFYVRLAPASDERRRLLVARVCTGLAGVIGTAGALLLATMDVRSLWDLFLTLLGLTGGAMAGLFALGIFSRSANGHGALIGACAAVIVVYTIRWQTDVHFALYAAIGIFTTCIVGSATSRLFPHADKDIDGLTWYSLHPAPECSTAKAEMASQLEA